MTPEEFKNVVDRVFKKVEKVLLSKNEEYSRDNERLHNFKKVAAFRKKSAEECLWGMAMKHFTSIDDMVQDTENGKKFSMDLWDEKLIDGINYLILLRALIIDNKVDWN